MLKRHFFIVAAAIAVGLMVVASVLRISFAGGDEPGPGGRDRTQAVSAAVVSSRPFSDSLQVLGVARGRRSLDITSSTTELISRVMFNDGQRVAAGAPLVELRADEQAADAIEARSRMEQAERTWRRWQELADRGIAPRVTAEEAQATYEAARASYQAAQARRGERVIRAPFAGVVGLSDVTPGALVNPGTVIATLDDISVVRVEFPVPERYLSAITTGLPVTATADAWPGEVFSGRIALLDTRINEQTRAITARAEFANASGRIRPGMMMRVSIERGERRAPAVPESAVQYEGASAYVYRIVSADEGATAQRLTVETGVVENGFVEILSGLSLNEQVVGSGLNRIQPGAPVRVATPATRTAAAEADGGAPPS